MEDLYMLGAYIVGGISFLIIWLIALGEWGFLIGLMIGWIPAFIGGSILGFFWPLTVSAVIFLFSHLH